MRLILLPDAKALALHLAEGVAALVKAQPQAVLILPSGRTPELAYGHLARWVAMGQWDPSGVTAFALDEVVGWGAGDAHSFATYHAEHVWKAWGLAPERCHVPDGKAPNPSAEARRYDALLKAAAPPALSLLGLGANGHVAFNEPAATLPVGAGEVALAPGSAGGAERGITLALDAIGSAQRVWLAAAGPRKAGAAKAMLEGPLDPLCPASLLRIHPQLTVLLDAEAAAQLSPATLALAQRESLF